MNTRTLLSSLLLTLVAGVAAPAHAAPDGPSSLAPETCRSARHELDAVGEHLRTLRAEREGQPQALGLHEKLAGELSAHIEALQARLPTQGTQRAQASVLLSDMRDALVLMRGASHADARQLAVERIENDHRLYSVLLENLGCAASRSPGP